MKNTFLLVLAVVVTVLAGALVIQLAAPAAPVLEPQQAVVVRPGGERVEVQTHVEIPTVNVGTTLTIE